ncbi:MAG: type II toxin-antitoxin system VapC family toxin [Candidatus Binataceae bacterium]
MKGLDTNLLVRYLVRDDPAQAAAARRFIFQNCTSQDPGFVNRIVICELVWVLESRYRLDRGQIVDALSELLEAEQLLFENEEDLRTAVAQYREGADLADGLLAAVNRKAGCDYTATFARKAGRLEGFRVLR